MDLKEKIKKLVNVDGTEVSKIFRMLSKNEKQELKNSLPELRKYKTVYPSEKVFCLLNDLIDRPLCPYCKENSLTYYSGKEKTGYIGKSCKKCLHIATLENIKKELGIDDPNITNISQLPGHGDKIREKMNSKTKEEKQAIVDKREETCLGKHGKRNVSQVDWVKDKKTETNIKHWDVVCVFQSPIIKEMIKKYWQDNFDVDNPSQLFEMRSKKAKSAVKKEFTFPSGRKISVQGYEDLVLSILLELGINEDNLLCQEKIIEYKNKKWVVDIFVKSMNSLIDVKSPYYMQFDRENLKCKIIEGRNLGFDSFILLYHKNCILRLDPSDNLENNEWYISNFYNVTENEKEDSLKILKSFNYVIIEKENISLEEKI